MITLSFMGSCDRSRTWSFVGVANEAVADATAGSTPHTVCPAATHALQQQHLSTSGLDTHLRELKHTLSHGDRGLPRPDEQTDTNKETDQVQMISSSRSHTSSIILNVNVFSVHRVAYRA